MLLGPAMDSHSGVMPLSDSVFPPKGGETHYGGLPVATCAGHSRLHKINELYGGLKVLQAGTRK